MENATAGWHEPGLCRTKCGRRYGKRESMGVNKDRYRRNGQKEKVYLSC